MGELFARFFGLIGIVGGFTILWVAYASGFYPLIFIGVAVLLAFGYEGDGG